MRGREYVSSGMPCAFLILCRTASIVIRPKPSRSAVNRIARLPPASSSTSAWASKGDSDPSIIRELAKPDGMTGMPGLGVMSASAKPAFQLCGEPAAAAVRQKLRM